MHLAQTISILTAREVPPGEMVADPRVAVDAAFAADDDEDDGYAAAAADFKVRNFLKVKQGPLLRYFNQGYEPRWIYLVDQHILDFENEASVVPSRIYELKYPHTVVVRVCICNKYSMFYDSRNKIALTAERHRHSNYIHQIEAQPQDCAFILASGNGRGGGRLARHHGCDI